MRAFFLMDDTELDPEIEDIEYDDESSFVLQSLARTNKSSMILSETSETAPLEPVAGHHRIFLLLIILNVWTTVSNATVIFVLFRTPGLRRRFGCVMYSLSFADFCSSVIVMPLAIYYFSSEAGWLIGSYLCVWWVTADVFFCTASICHHVSIAIHRYMAIAKPYQMNMITSNTPIILKLILPSWAIGFLIALILAIQALIREDIVFRQDSCGLQDRLYVIYSSVVSFFIPLSVIILVSLKSIFLLRRHLKIKQQQTAIADLQQQQQQQQLQESSLTSSPHHLSEAKRSISISANLTNNQHDVSFYLKSPPHVVITENSVVDDSPSKVVVCNNVNNEEDKSKLNQTLAKPPRKSIFKLPTISKRALSFSPVVNNTKNKTGNMASRASENLFRRRATVEQQSKLTTLRTLFQSFLEIDSTEYALRNQGTKKKTSPSKDTKSFLTPRSSSTDTVDAATSVNDSPSNNQNGDDFFQNRISTSTKRSSAAQMEAIQEQEEFLSSPVELTPSPFADKQLDANIRRNFSNASIGSEAFFGDDQLNVDLTLFPTNDAESAVISVDEMTPSVDMMTSFGFVIPEIPSPVDEEHPLDLRVVFSRTVPSFREVADRMSCNEVRNYLSVRRKQQSASPSVVKKKSFRKRAYTICFPINYILVQQAPLAALENFATSPDPGLLMATPRKSPVSKSSSIRSRNASFKGSPHFRFSNQSSAVALSPTASPFSDSGRRISRRSQRISRGVKRNSSLCSSHASPKPGATSRISLRSSTRPSSESSYSSNQGPTPRPSSIDVPTTADSNGSHLLLQPFNLPPAVTVSDESVDEKAEIDDYSNERVCKIEVPPKQDDLDSPIVQPPTRRSHSDVSFERVPSFKLTKQLPEVDDKKLRKTAKQKQREKEKQAERVLIFVLFIFVCLWLPFFTTNFLYGICPTCVYEDVFVAFTWCGWCSSAINPIVYTFFNRDFKRAFIRLFCQRCSEKLARRGKLKGAPTISVAAATRSSISHAVNYPDTGNTKSKSTNK